MNYLKIFIEKSEFSKSDVILYIPLASMRIECLKDIDLNLLGKKIKFIGFEKIKSHKICPKVKFPNSKEIENIIKIHNLNKL